MSPDEAEPQGARGSSEGVVQPSKRYLEAADPNGESRPDPARSRRAPQGKPSGVPQRKLEDEARSLGAVRIPSVESRERGPSRPDRGAALERSRQAGAAKRGSAEHPVESDPHLEIPIPRGAAEGARAPPSPSLPVEGPELQPLDPDAQGDRPRRALPDLQARSGFASPRAPEGHVAQAGRDARPHPGRVHLVLLEALRLEERGVTRADPPARAAPFLEKEPRPVGGRAAQGAGARVAQLERGAGARRPEEGRERGDRARQEGRPHRSITVSARLPLLAGSAPSGIVSARAI